MTIDLSLIATDELIEELGRRGSGYWFVIVDYPEVVRKGLDFRVWAGGVSGPRGSRARIMGCVETSIADEDERLRGETPAE